MPVLSRPGMISQAVQISGNPLSAVTLAGVLVKNQTDNGSLFLVDLQVKKLMLFLVEPSAFHQIVAVGRKAALEVTGFHKLTQTGAGTDGGFLTFPIGLPEADVIEQLVRMIVEPLLPFPGAPNLNAVLAEPLHNEGRFVCDSADTVKHEYKEDVKLPSGSHGLDDLQFVPGFGTNLMPGHAFLLFLMDDCPAHLRGKAVTGFSLHGNISLMVFGIVHLLARGYTVQAANSVLICHCSVLLSSSERGIFVWDVELSRCTSSLYPLSPQSASVKAEFIRISRILKKVSGIGSLEKVAHTSCPSTRNVF